MKIIFQATKYNIMEWCIDSIFNKIQINFKEIKDNKVLPQFLQIDMNVDVTLSTGWIVKKYDYI